MKRRGFIGALLSAAFWQTTAQAQERTRVATVGYVDAASRQCGYGRIAYRSS